MGAHRIEQEWVDLVADVLSEPLRELPHQRIAAELIETFDVTGCSFNDSLPGPGVLRLNPRDQDYRGQRRELVEWRDDREWEHPLLIHYATTTDRRPRQIADIAPRLDQRQLGTWTDFARSGGFDHQLLLPLGTVRPDARAFVLARDAAFSPREVSLATRLWRLIASLDRHVAALTSVRGDGGAREPELTTREAAVLGLAAEGLTASAIGRRLEISVRTVHKHLEHVYTKLHVSDRVSAVLRARELGLLDPPPPP